MIVPPPPLNLIKWAFKVHSLQDNNYDTVKLWYTWLLSPGVAPCQKKITDIAEFFQCFWGPATYFVGIEVYD
jgi:hypothetical protein